MAFSRRRWVVVLRRASSSSLGLDGGPDATADPVADQRRSDADHGGPKVEILLRAQKHPRIPPKGRAPVDDAPRVHDRVADDGGAETLIRSEGPLVAVDHGAANTCGYPLYRERVKAAIIPFVI